MVYRSLLWLDSSEESLDGLAPSLIDVPQVSITHHMPALLTSGMRSVQMKLRPVYLASLHMRWM